MLINLPSQICTQEYLPCTLFCLKASSFPSTFVHPLTYNYTNTRSSAHTFQQNCSVSYQPASTVEFSQESIVMKPGGYSEDESTDVFMGEFSSDSSSSRGTKKARASSSSFRKESGYGSDPITNKCTNRSSRNSFQYRSYSSVTSNGRARPSLGRGSRSHVVDNHSFSTTSRTTSRTKTN